MGILTPSENQAAADHQPSGLEEAIAYCNSKIQGAMAEDEKFVRVVTGIPYSGYRQQEKLEEALRGAGYRVDSEMQVRHGLVIDIEWD